MDTVKPESVGMSGERLKRIHPMLQRYVDEGKFAGMSVAIARHGKPVYSDCAGLMDIESGKPVQEDTIFRIYSMSKIITSVALMTLYEEGHFRLNDPVTNFIPEFGQLGVFDRYASGVMKTVGLERPATIRHLLSHTAGLTYPWQAATQVGAMYAEGDLWAGDLHDMIAGLLKYPLAYQPGTTWHYSMATDVVGRLVEIISGMTLAEFLQARIFAPLGMVDTAFDVPQDKMGRFATLYNWNEAEGKLATGDRPPKTEYARPKKLYSGGGGLVSTLGDYYRFTQMLLNKGELDGVRLLGRKTVELMTINHLPPGMRITTRFGGHGFGLGAAVLVDAAQFGELGSVGSYYWDGAANTVFWIDPKEDLLGVLMTQFMPCFRFPLDTDLRLLAYQAIID